MAVLAVRLDSQSEAVLEKLVRETGHTKSELVREALTDFSRRKSGVKSGRRPYDLMKDGIGIWRSGGLNLSENTGDRFYEMLVADHERETRGESRRVKTAGRSQIRSRRKSK